MNTLQKVRNVRGWLVASALCVVAVLPAFAVKPYDAEVEYLDANAEAWVSTLL